MDDRRNTTGRNATRPELKSSRFPVSIGLALAGMVLVGALFSLASQPASAVAAPIDQCNDDTASNVGGQGISCTVTIVNYVTGTGTLDATPPSTVTVTVCVGAAGVIAAGGGTCTTTTTTSSEPVTLVRQCNGSGNGGGGVVICSVTVTNNFSSSPVEAAVPADVYQCIGSEITGPGAPAICTPDNTPGITSVEAATVGQCNGSGNGGTSVGFICTVSTGSTTTSILPVNIDQCNDSANGGGSLVECSARVTNVVLQVPTPTSTATPTASATPVAPTSTPTASATAIGPTSTATAIGPTSTATAIGPTPTATQGAAPTIVTPGAPSAGTGTSSDDTGSTGPLVLAMGVAVLVFALGFSITSSRRAGSRQAKGDSGDNRTGKPR